MIVGLSPQVRKVYGILRYNNEAFSAWLDHEEWNVDQKLKSFIESANSGWYAEYELPISSTRKVGQSGLEAELDRDHLLLRNINCAEGQLFFIVQCSPVSMSTQNYLNASEKKLIEQLLRGIINKAIEQREKDLNLLKRLAKSSETSILTIQALEQKLEQRDQYFENHLGQVLRMSIQRLEKKFGVKINYARDFLKALVDHQGPMENIESLLEQEIELASNLALLGGENEIHLHPSMLKKVAQPVSNTAGTETLKLGRYTKTYILLDRYEKSAERVQSAGKSIIGKHIGEYCEPSISNAAITDALNKHARKIYELFERYPERWPILRSEFRSIANIMEKETERRRASGA